jgi:hypothetical protein
VILALVPVINLAIRAVMSLNAVLLIHVQIVHLPVVELVVRVIAVLMFLAVLIRVM